MSTICPTLVFKLVNFCIIVYMNSVLFQQNIHLFATMCHHLSIYDIVHNAETIFTLCICYKTFKQYYRCLQRHVMGRPIHFKKRYHENIHVSNSRRASIFVYHIPIGFCGQQLPHFQEKKGPKLIKLTPPLARSQGVLWLVGSQSFSEEVVAAAGEGVVRRDEEREGKKKANFCSSTKSIIQFQLPPQESILPAFYPGNKKLLPFVH